MYCDDIYSDVIREEFDDDSFDRVDKRRARFNRNVKRNKAIVRDYNLIARSYCNLIFMGRQYITPLILLFIKRFYDDMLIIFIDT